jgi:hypothetical protein
VNGDLGGPQPIYLILYRTNSGQKLNFAVIFLSIFKILPNKVQFTETFASAYLYWVCVSFVIMHP